MGTVVLTSIIHQEPQRSFLILLVLLAALQSGNASAETPRSNDLRPNIIRIMADDLGYGELGSYSHNTTQAVLPVILLALHFRQDGMH